jgi:NAD(P)-dependent dehydrogenase (short-subunit alcohol dehydrogenase family)
MGCDPGDQPVLGLPHHRRRAAGDAEAGWGRIVNIASAHGLTASPFKSAYIAAKHGIVGLSKTVALETAGQGITCNAICPGYVLTPLVEAQIPDQMKVHNMDRETVIREVMLAASPAASSPPPNRSAAPWSGCAAPTPIR